MHRSIWLACAVRVDSLVQHRGNMEVKILCACGTKYMFDVEPVHGQLPGPVSCPACLADGTAAGNAIIAEKLNSPSATIRVTSAAPASGFVRPALARSSKEHSPAPAPAASDHAPSPPANVSTPGAGARLGLPTAHTVKPAAPEIPVPTVAAASPKRKVKEDSGPSDMRGVIGAAVAGLVGMIIWTVLIVVTDREIGWVAWGVGGLVGAGAKMFGRGESDGIGLAAAGAALIAILLGQFLATRHAMNRFTDTLQKMAYEEHVAYAKEAVAAQGDAQIRTLLAKQEVDEDETPDPATVSEQQISEFKKELPKLKKVASGQVSQAEFKRENDFSVPTSFILKNSFSLFTLLWIFLGVGTAYRIASAGG
jgi:hypothetical protein